jgi:two-component system, NarL family, sensor kinase
VGVLILARRNPEAVLHPLVAAGDLAVLLLLELVTPEAYAAVRFAALFLIAAHAHFQGEGRGLAIAALGVVALVVPTAIRGEGNVTGDMRVFYESVFGAAALATGLLVGRWRTEETASRLRARRLSRRTIQSEGEVRRRVAEAIHDGPVQELIGLDMMLAAARDASDAGETQRAGELIAEARQLTERNVQMLRDEIVAMGPYAFEELTLGMAIENCLPLWKRRYGFEVLATIERVDLSPEMAGHLFRITQEAVINAGRHAEAEAVSISVRQLDEEVELRVTDNGKGFDHAGPLGATEPGHLGLQSIRERAELLEGRLTLESSPKGTKVVVSAPLVQRGD